MTKTPIRRIYSEFRGVDFSSDPSIVNLSRSPDALNVWKNYSDTQGTCIETRPGIGLLKNFSSQINGMFVYKGKALVHAGTYLYLWNNFPDTQGTKTTLKSDMQNKKSAFVIFNDEVFILDGANFLVYNTTLNAVTSTNPYIPTTSIGRSPSGGGTNYEDVNVLTPQRKNSFVGDGTSVNYYLDADEITSVTKIWVNNTELQSGYSVDITQGKITFNTAPAAPTIPGIDNVVIQFSKTVNSYTTRISKCNIITAYDRRLFFAGNPDYPNAIFHSELNNPYYIRDLAYYEDGTEESSVKALVVGNNILWVFKAQSQQNDTIFYHTASLDTEGKVYPNYQGNVSVGCYSEAINYKDDIVFLSRNGLEGISSDEITSKQLLNHRSSLVDSKLVNENNFDLSMLEEWEGYLLILVNGHIYLADYRQRFEGNIGYEYEWYYWDFGAKNVCYIKQYNGKLYVGTSSGKVYVITGANDDGDLIESYWTTPMDNFGYGNTLKTTNKRGGVAKIKTIPNGLIKIAEITNKRIDEKDISAYSASGFDFNNLDFGIFSFTTINKSSVVYKIKEKKFIEISLKFYSDQVNKPFGLYSAILEAFVGGYVKR